MRAAHHGFPGEIAGASLKPGRKSDTIAASERGIPRRNRRGLIEAHSRTRSTISGYSRFPGEIAGASLKPEVALRLVDAGGGRFPGEIAGASLKRPVAELHVPPDDLDSPAKSPGPH